MAGMFFVLVGVWWLLESLTVFEIDVRDYWPLLLVFFGSYLVWQGLSVRARPSVLEGGSMVSALAILGAVTRGSNVRDFRGADLTAIMGGCEIDLRNAAIDGEAYVDVFALWGGIEIRVPDTWTIESRVVPILGGVDDQTRAPQSAAVHRLILRGVAIMGGVEIKN